MIRVRVFLACVLACLCLPSGGAGAQVVTEFSAGITANAASLGITAGPDGNLWFAEQTGNRIARIITPGPALLSAVSRKVHGAAGTFDPPLTLAP
jgi:streptogramin lyase